MQRPRREIKHDDLKDLNWMGLAERESVDIEVQDQTSHDSKKERPYVILKHPKGTAEHWLVIPTE